MNIKKQLLIAALLLNFICFTQAMNMESLNDMLTIPVLLPSVEKLQEAFDKSPLKDIAKKTELAKKFGGRTVVPSDLWLEVKGVLSSFGPLASAKTSTTARALPSRKTVIVQTPSSDKRDSVFPITGQNQLSDIIKIFLKDRPEALQALTEAKMIS